MSYITIGTLVLDDISDEELAEIGSAVRAIINMCRTLKLCADTIIYVPPVAKIDGGADCHMSYIDASYLLGTIEEEIEIREWNKNGGGRPTWQKNSR